MQINRKFYFPMSCGFEIDIAVPPINLDSATSGCHGNYTDQSLKECTLNKEIFLEKIEMNDHDARKMERNTAALNAVCRPGGYKKLFMEE